MLEEEIKGQRDNSLTVNYNNWIFDSISPYVGSRVMDIGSGMGNFLGYLADKELVVVIDIADIFIEGLRKRYSAQKNINIFKCDIQDEAVIQIADKYNVDTIICNNVLEHVQDDVRALSNMRKILKNDGNLVLVLPAFRFLYSKWDRSVGHYRRYNLGEIKEKLAGVGFAVQISFYLNFAGFFAWFLHGKILRSTPNTGYQIEKQAVFFDRYLVKYLQKIEKVFHPPFGQSLIVVAGPAKT